jgi:glycosyltransferase involved in cell wall biosynthesis
MRILWAGVGPWHTSAYGQQGDLFPRRLRDLLGHEVAVWYFGRKGIDDDPEQAHPRSRAALRSGLWDGMRIAGAGQAEFALPAPEQARELFGGHDPDLTICLKDPFVLRPGDYKDRTSAVWANIDCTPLGYGDQFFFTSSGAAPIATSRFGMRQLEDAGFAPRYVPHGIDLSLWRPPESKAAAKAHIGIPPDSFVAGICAMNVGTVSRKAFYEQMAGFSQFTERGRVPNCYLLMHTRPDDPAGIDLRTIARHLGIEHQVLFGKNDQQRPADMLTWYQSLDVLLSATYGEGFGVPVIEALACGVPVIGSRNSAVTEKIGSRAGWLVGCQPFWHPEFRAEWAIPRISEIAAALQCAMGGRQVPPESAAAYDADSVTLNHWKPVLDELGAAQ